MSWWSREWSRSSGRVVPALGVPVVAVMVVVAEGGIGVDGRDEVEGGGGGGGQHGVRSGGERRARRKRMSLM